MALETLDARKPKQTPSLNVGVPLKKVSAKPLHYTDRHRGQWFKPEYDLEQIQIAQDTDSYLFRAIQKKVNRFMIAGWELHGVTPEVVDYVNRRVAELEYVSSYPFSQLIRDTVHDLNRFSNCMWVKVRDPEASSGDIRVDLRGIELKPVAAYFILPFETLEFKTKPNGEIIKILQRMPGGGTKEFLAQDIIHFYTNKKPGFAIGTPEIFPALDDIALLRRIEENVEELIETNLFPVFHYKVGSDDFPERYSPDGLKETDIVKQTLEYMPAGSIYVSDHRHNIDVLGSESQALRVDFYLEYFKKRVFSGLGISSIDLGEGDTANKSTAGTLSKALLQDVEAMQNEMKMFLEFYVFNELLLEGGYNPLTEEESIEIKFGVVDKEDRSKLENQVLQMAQGNMYTITEARALLGKRAYKEEEFDDTFFKRFTEPLALIQSAGPGMAAADALAATPTSNITPEGVAGQKQFAQQQAQAAASARGPGAPRTKTQAAGSAKQSASKARPSNQHGTRTSAKFSKDIKVIQDGWTSSFIEQGLGVPDENNVISKLYNEYQTEIDSLNRLLEERIQDTNCSSETVYDNLSYRLVKLDKHFADLAYKAGLDHQSSDRVSK